MNYFQRVNIFFNENQKYRYRVLQKSLAKAFLEYLPSFDTEQLLEVSMAISD